MLCVEVYINRSCSQVFLRLFFSVFLDLLIRALTVRFICIFFSVSFKFTYPAYSHPFWFFVYLVLPAWTTYGRLTSTFGIDLLLVFDLVSFFVSCANNGAIVKFWKGKKNKEKRTLNSTPRITPFDHILPFQPSCFQSRSRTFLRYKFFSFSLLVSLWDWQMLKNVDDVHWSFFIVWHRSVETKCFFVRSRDIHRENRI